MRLVLFFEARARRFTDAPSYNPDEDANHRATIVSLLEAIRERAREER